MIAVTIIVRSADDTMKLISALVTAVDGDQVEDGRSCKEGRALEIHHIRNGRADDNVYGEYREDVRGGTDHNESQGDSPRSAQRTL